MESLTRALVSVLCLMVTLLPGARAEDSDIVGMAIAGCLGFFLLSVVIAFIVVSCNWNDWYQQWMRQKGKVRMPREYFKKKEEARKKLISESVASYTSEVNGTLPGQTVDRDGQEVFQQNHIVTALQTNAAVNNAEPGTYYSKFARSNQLGIANVNQTQAQNTTSWVQGWKQTSNGFANRVYEEKDVTMELGEENVDVNDEFRIEAEVVDNEVLDVGPYKSDHKQEVAVQGDVYPEPYIYTTVDYSKKTSPRSEEYSRSTTVVTTTTQEMREIDTGYATAGDVHTVQASEGLVHL